MGAKTSEVKVGVTPCECCGKASITTSASGVALCAGCNKLTKTGAVIEPSIRQAPERLAERLTK